MPRSGLGMPITSSSVGGAVLNVDDVLWESFGSDEIAINYAENYTNIILHSQDVTDAEAWTKQNTAISTTLYEAPDNSTTANAIKSNTTGSKNYYLQQQSLSVTAGKTYTASVHLKKGALGFGWLRAGDGTTNYSAVFNLNTGAVTNTSQVLSTSVDAMDDDWFRCSVTFQAQNTSSNGNVIVFAQIDATDNTPNVAASGVELLYVWGWQLEENIEASPYIVTTTEARTATETLNDLSSIWDFDSANLMPEADPDSEGVWETLDNLVLNGTYEELGSELVTNGTFDVDANWTTATGWTISGGTAICDGSQSGNAELKQQNGVAGVTLNIVNGKTYELTFDLVVQTGAITQVEIGNTYDTNDITSSGTYTRTLKASSTNKRLTIAGNSTFEGSVDNVTLKQVDPNDRWSLEGDWEISNGSLNIDSASIANAKQNGLFTVGDTYEMNFNLSISSGYVRVYFGTSANTIQQQITSSGNYTIRGVAEHTSLTFRSGTNTTCSIDNVTVREYAIQPQDV